MLQLQNIISKIKFCFELCSPLAGGIFCQSRKNLFADELAAATDFYILHWDGNVFKALTHCSSKDERVAVLLTTSEGEDILLGIIAVENGSAAEELFKILNLLIKKGIDLIKIIACAFDTTVVDIGEKNNIVKRLRTFFSRAPLKLACRYHIYKLVCGVVSEFVLGKSTRTKNKRPQHLMNHFSRSCVLHGMISIETQKM